jgi:RNA polymerase sigma factor (sigma-70 family)
MNADEKEPVESSSSIHSTLLRDVRAHDPDAWGRIVHVFSPLIFDWCRQQGLQNADAADVMQEVFRGVMKNVDTFRREKPGDSFRGWLWIITRNKIRDYYRARAARPDARGGSDAGVRMAMIPDRQQDAPLIRLPIAASRTALNIAHWTWSASISNRGRGLRSGAWRSSEIRRPTLPPISG